MRLALLVMSMLLLGIAPVQAAGGKKVPKPAAEAGKSARGTPSGTADATQEIDPAERAKYEKLGPLMTEIGTEAAMIAGGKIKGLFLYAEMKGKHATVFVFRDRGKTVMQYADTDLLRDLVEQAWALEPAGKRWVILSFEVQAGTFDARLVYPEEVDLKRPIEERVLALMPKGFAGKKMLVERKRPADEAPAEDAAGEPVPVPVGRWS